MRGIKQLGGYACSLLLGWSLPLLAAEPVQLFAWEHPPQLYMTTDGRAAGVVAELTAQLFNQVGVTYRLSFQPLQRALQRVQREANSCVLLVERQQEREPHYAWVGPLLVSRLGLYARADDPLQLNSLEQARGLRILSYQGSGAGEYLHQVGLEVIASNKESLNLSMLQRSRAQLWATSSVVVSSMRGRPAPRLVLPFLTLMEDMACHPQFDPALQQRLQATLLQLYSEGWVQALYQRHGLQQE
ncbi:substrate-binding periplasmic protein [Pseudomonas leptonychotis]|uniref:substrate-binding periplasmic protein n=1 Tax=Pseudomonas leptonychotis TaxID=2448482 RepID=UPI00386ACAE2